MANRDLKNSPRPSRGRSSSSSSRSGGGGMMAGIIIGLIVGVAVAVGLAMYLNRSPAPFQAKGERKPEAASQAPTELLAPGTRISDAASATAPAAAQPQPKQATLDSDTVALPPPAAPAPAPHEAKPKAAPAGQQAKSDKNDQRFDFYKILPGQVDAVTSDAKGSRAAEPSASAPAKKVYLQLGAFQNQDDADNLKAKLALLGVEAKIQSVNVPDKGMVHRVRVGPLSRQDEVDRVRAQLKQDGINANVVKAE
ncbi:SPOR domain-containing protein [Chromobacterium subtsugae]|uniref:SPOR domain-containing protein n=1 Tax=Chromobacterium subtsugae TaxID=251747 RepID=A0ABS7FFW9_9NEIS|nr:MULTISPECIES: SPOR domain-containing protein [Chromobacterium]KUM04011.1 sporulation protein [Chromobacterium subtsugae]KZE86471.1 sporulation protein [Chromobacterium sp. F49]MBW7567739.1 SPOR domain-containing protein [Chromobacterium subtsugae]MBW8288965.1 SPOR domain-containing protein [Chromobacterium subtsugae]OBU85661.1 sporulation protein [Chromobacterium subtsugae]